MEGTIHLGNAEHSAGIEGELARIRDSGVLGRSNKLRDLFDYLVERSKSGEPPREIEIMQDVFSRNAEANDDGSGRVYIHRLRRKLDDFYKAHKASGVKLSLPLGEYRIVATIGNGKSNANVDISSTVDGSKYVQQAKYLLAAGAGALAALIAFLLVVEPRPAGLIDSSAVRDSAVWAPLLENGRDVIVAEGDHFLFAEQRTPGNTVRLVRDFDIHDRKALDAYLMRHPDKLGQYIDKDLGYIPRTLPRAQLYLSHILLEAPSVRALPASQISDSTMLSQNIVYLGLVSGLGPLRPPTVAASRFDLDEKTDEIRDIRTGTVFANGPYSSNALSPKRQYGLVSLFPGKEGNRYIVAAGTSEMGLVGLVEALADPERLADLVASAGTSNILEAVYQIDSQGNGILAVKLLVTNSRRKSDIWQPN